MSVNSGTEKEVIMPVEVKACLFIVVLLFCFQLVETKIRKTDVIGKRHKINNI